MGDQRAMTDFDGLSRIGRNPCTISRNKQYCLWTSERRENRSLVVWLVSKMVFVGGEGGGGEYSL